MFRLLIVSTLANRVGRRRRVRLNEHRNACKSEDLRSKIFQHSINLDHRPNFSNPSILTKNCDYTVKRIFLEAFFYKVI